MEISKQIFYVKDLTTQDQRRILTDFLTNNPVAHNFISEQIANAFSENHHNNTVAAVAHIVRLINYANAIFVDSSVGVKHVH